MSTSAIQYVCGCMLDCSLKTSNLLSPPDDATIGPMKLEKETRYIRNRRHLHRKHATSVQPELLGILLFAIRHAQVRFRVVVRIFLLNIHLAGYEFIIVVWLVDWLVGEETLSVWLRPARHRNI